MLFRSGRLPERADRSIPISQHAQGTTLEQAGDGPGPAGLGQFGEFPKRPPQQRAGVFRHRCIGVGEEFAEFDIPSCMPQVELSTMAVHGSEPVDVPSNRPS